jgi:hypothetical protein
MDKRSWLHPLTGVLFVVVLIVAFALGGEPPDAADEPVQEVVDFYADNEDSVFIGGVLQGIGGALLIFFGGYLYKRLRAAGAEASAAVAFGGLIALAVGIALDGTINIALTELVNGDEGPDEGAVQALGVLWTNDFLPLAMGMAVFLWGTGVAVVRHGGLPTWMGWVAIVAAITAISPAFFVAGIVAALLVLVSSIMFSMEERSGGAAT